MAYMWNIRNAGGSCRRRYEKKIVLPKCVAKSSYRSRLWSFWDVCRHFGSMEHGPDWTWSRKKLRSTFCILRDPPPNQPHVDTRKAHPAVNHTSFLWPSRRRTLSWNEGRKRGAVFLLGLLRSRMWSPEGGRGGGGMALPDSPVEGASHCPLATGMGVQCGFHDGAGWALA